MSWSADWPLTINAGAWPKGYYPRIKASHVNELVQAVNERSGWVNSLTTLNLANISSVAVSERIESVFINSLRTRIKDWLTPYFMHHATSGVPDVYTWTELQDDALGTGNTLPQVNDGSVDRIAAQWFNDLRLILNKMTDMCFSPLAYQIESRGREKFNAGPYTPASSQADLDAAFASVEGQSDYANLVIQGIRQYVRTATPSFTNVLICKGGIKFFKWAEFPSGTVPSSWTHYYPAVTPGDLNTAGTNVPMEHFTSDPAWADNGTNAYTFSGATTLTDQWYTFSATWPSGSTASWYFKANNTLTAPYNAGTTTHKLGFMPDFTGMKLIVVPNFTQK